jgi:GAF domain-containing protein
MTISEISSDTQMERLQDWRERILRILLIVIFVTGTPFYVVNIFNFIEFNNWVFLTLTTVSYLLLFFVTILRDRTPFSVRTVSILTIAYVFVILSFQNTGLSGDSHVWLLFFIVFSTIMLGLRAGIIAMGITAATYVTAGFLILNGILSLQVQEADSYSLQLSSWITSGFAILFVGIILSISIGLLIQGLEKNLIKLQESFVTETEFAKKLEQEHSTLEIRTIDLERRVTQIRTAAEISRSLGTILNPQDLLQNVADLVKDRFNLYYVGVFLVDENQRYAVLSAGTGEAGQRMMDEDHRLIIGGSSMVGWTTAHGQPRIALDAGKEAIRFSNPHLPDTRSELALPLAIGNQIRGALSVQSLEQEAFDEDDITVLQGIADSLAIALENARLFQQIEESLKEIQFLNRQYLGETWANIMFEEKQDLSYTLDSELLDEQETSEVTVPLILRGDQVIGNITMETTRKEFSPDEREFIDAISTQAALALESARLLDEANKRVEREQALQQLTTKFATTLDFDKLLQTVVSELGQLPMVAEASIHITPPRELEDYQNGNPQVDISE